MKKELFRNYYMSLFDDGTLGFSDGVGYIETLKKEEVKALYEAMEKYFKKEQINDLVRISEDV